MGEERWERGMRKVNGKVDGGDEASSWGKEKVEVDGGGGRDVVGGGTRW